MKGTFAPVCRHSPCNHTTVPVSPAPGSREPRGSGEQTDCGLEWPSGVLQAAFSSLTVPHLFCVGEEDGRDQSKLETKVWEAHNPLVDKQIDQFLVVAR